MLLRKLTLRIMPKYLGHISKVSLLKNPCPTAIINIPISGFCSTKN